ncbi:hypothetical protein [Azospirillum doebereinerae]
MRDPWGKPGVPHDHCLPLPSFTTSLARTVATGMPSLRSKVKTLSYDFLRLLDSKKSMSERPLVLLWTASAGATAEFIFLTCLEQYKNSPSKAKAKVMFDWLVDQDPNKKMGDGYWMQMNIESDGASDQSKAVVIGIGGVTQYYNARKTWWGKRTATFNPNLGNTPAPDLFDGLIEQARVGLGLAKPPYSNWRPESFDFNGIGIPGNLKGIEYMSNAFRSAGFNTALMGVRLPFKFR